MQNSMEELTPFLRQVFGSRMRLVERQVVKQDVDYLVILARLEQPAQQVIIKLAWPKATRPSRFARTAALLRLVGQRTSIPVPEVLAVDETCRKIPWRCLITTYLPGQLLAAFEKTLRPQAQANVYGQLGEAVAQLHQIPFGGFGELDAGLKVVPTPGLPAPGFRAALAERAKRMLPNARGVEYFLHVLERFAGLFDSVAPPCLCHEDLHSYNLLFREEKSGWQLATILDFDKAWAGCGEADLARMALWKTAGAGFWPAYTTHHKLGSLLTLRRPIFQLFWCLEYAEQSAEHLATTRQICQSLGMPVIRSFAPFEVQEP